MSVDQGLLSPPSSGRAYKSDKPRLGNSKEYSGQDIFGATTRHALQPQNNTYPTSTHTLPYSDLSPAKKKEATADDITRPPTPPMSRDIRHDQEHKRDHVSSASTFSDSDVETERAASTSSHPVQLPSQAARGPLPEASSSALLGRSRPVTLTQTSFESDEEHNPFLDRGSTSQQSSATAHHSHPYYDEHDSEADGEGEVDEMDTLQLSEQDSTPRAAGLRLQGQASTQPFLQLARPLSDHVSVENHCLATTLPIRDTPKNPFLAGGPADIGLYGPWAEQAQARARVCPRKESGKITYVFRGQRVTYADPEYDSDDSGSDAGSARGPRPPRLQPKLLFPPAAAAPAERSRSRTCSSGAEARAERSPSLGGRSTGGGGLFAAQLAAKRKRADGERGGEERRDAQHAAPAWIHDVASSSSRLQAATSMPAAARTGASTVCPKQAQRDALLARLDQTNWSDDDDEDDDPHMHGADAVAPPAKRGRTSTYHTEMDEDSEEDPQEHAFWLTDTRAASSTVAPPPAGRLAGRMRGRHEASTSDWLRRY